MGKMLPRIIFVLGRPGAGKGTQCQNIMREFNFEHISAGDLLRDEITNPNSKYGEFVKRYIQEGKIVPVEITCNLLERALQKSKRNKFLIDGFPRNHRNLEGWNRHVAPKVDFLCMLLFECDTAMSVKRCLARGASGSGRTDDNIETLHKRLKIYEEDTKPIIQYYQNLNKVHRINANQLPDKVFEDVSCIFRKYSI